LDIAYEGYMKRILWLLPLAALATVGGGPSVNAQRDGENRWVVVLNERSSDMMRLYASRTTKSDWDRNMLPNPIPAGTKMNLNFDDGTTACHFDFRAVFRDKRTVHMWRINVCQESYWRVTD
jgi:hypothetical protein